MNGWDKFGKIWLLSLLTSLVAAVATLYMILASIENPGPSITATASVVLVVACYLVGPYLVFAAFAFALQSNRMLSGILFAIILVVAVSAVTCLYVEFTDWLSRDKTREVQRMVPFIIGLAEWTAAVSAVAILLPIFLTSRNSPRATT